MYVYSYMYIYAYTHIYKYILTYQNTGISNLKKFLIINCKEIYFQDCLKGLTSLTNTL